MSYDLGTAHGKITLDYDGHGATDRAAKDIDQLSKNSKKSDGDVRKLGISLSALGGIAKKMALGSAFAEASVGAASLSIQLLGMVPQLASLLSLAAAYPGAIVGIVASVGVLKTVFNGVSDSIKLAFDPKKADEFNKSLQDLSPSAAAFVSAIHNLAPELTTYGKAIQEAFFHTANLTALLPRAQSALATLSTPLRGLSSDFGKVTSEVGKFAISVESTHFAVDAINAFRQGLALVAPSIVPVLEGLREVGKVGLPLLNLLAAGVSGVATNFADWLHSIAQSGQLQTWINTALSTLSTLGSLLKNIGSIFVSVVTAAQSSGGGLLNTLADLTGQLSTFLKSTDGAAALQAIFSAIVSVAKPLGPIITTAAGALAKALGPAIIQITSVLGPALLDVVQRLAPALGPLAEALAGLIIAITPLLAPAAELISLLARFASVVITDVVNELGPLVNLLAGALLQSFEALQPAVDAFAQILPLAADAGIQLAKAFAPLAPAIVQVATALSQALVASMPDLIRALNEFIPVAVQFATVLSGELTKALIALIPYIPTLVKAFVKLIEVSGKIETTFLRVYTAVIKFVGAFLGIGSKVNDAADSFGRAIAGVFGQIGNLIQPVINVFKNLPSTIGSALSGLGGAISSAFSGMLTALSSLGGSVVAFFAALPGRILAGIQALPGLLIGFIKSTLTTLVEAVAFSIGLVVGIFTKLPGDILRSIRTLAPIVGNALKSAWNNAVSATQSGITAVINFAKELPGRARNAIISVISNIGSTLRAAWNAAYAATVSGINSAVSYARNLPGRIRNAISSMIGSIRNVASSAWNNFRSATVSGANNAVSFVRGIPGRLRSALGNVGGLLRSSGEAIINGLRNGISSGIDRVLGMIRDLANRAKVAFNDALSIFSPSRVFFQSGVFINEGLIKGIQSKMAEVGRTAKALAKTVIQPTLQLPTSATMAINGIPTLPAARADLASGPVGGDFGPYELKVNQGTLARFTIDAVTGAPKEVAKAAKEGDRQNQFAGTGRRVG